MNIDLAELSKESGKSEVEIAKTITRVLAVKAEVYEIAQVVILARKKESEG